MNKITNLLPLLAIFSTIFINVNTGLFTDSDTLKLIWMYLFVLPIILLSIFRNKTKLNIGWPIFIIGLPTIIAAISTILNYKIHAYFFHDLSVVIISIIIAIYFQNFSSQKIWNNLVLITIILTLVILIWTIISVNFLSHDPNTILLGNRNLTVNYLVLSIPILCYAIIIEKNIIKIFSIISIISIIILIIFYYPSRFGMIFSIFAMIIYALTQIKKININFRVLFLSILTCLIGLAFFNYSRFDAIFNLVGYYDRLTVYKIGLEAINSQYIFGYGLGSTSYVIDNFRVFQQDYSIYFDDTQFSQMHNEPIQYFIEGGVFAFFSYIIFLVLLIRNFLFLICRFKLDESAKAKIFALGISIAIGFLHSLVDIGIKSPFNRCYLYLLIGIFLSEVIYSKNHKS